MSPIFVTSIFKLKNLKLKERQKSQISNTVERIQNFAPKGSKISGNLKKESKFFEGNIRVSSKGGVFIAKAKSNSILSLMMALQAKLVRQLVRWKENRFSKRERRRQTQMERELVVLEEQYKKEA